jgi:hypothetical protein
MYTCIYILSRRGYLLVGLVVVVVVDVEVVVVVVGK